MALIDGLYIRKFHEAKFEMYGTDNSRSLGWSSRATQLQRFEELAQIGNLDHTSVLDIGCGNGDLCRYLHERYTGIYYSGVDLLPELLDNAIALNKDYPNTRFYLGDFMQEGLPAADYVLACGSLNYKNSDPAFIFKALTRLANLCHIGLGFNVLSRTKDPDGILMTYAVEEVEAFCKTIAPHVTLINHPGEGYFTIMLYKTHTLPSGC